LLVNVLDNLEARGYLEQCTNEPEVRRLLETENVPFYIGFDPTADSLHVGHFVQVMVMRQLQKAGHTPIALIGGGTAMIGDPSGRSTERNMMTFETVNHNAECFKKQMSRFIDFGEGKAIMVNNHDWLSPLNYIEFIRDIGSQFSVNKMLTAECFKTRMESDNGLSFLEFNYMLMQGYDFLVLNRKYGCKIEFGGRDQWSNILAGIELCRRKDQKEVHGMTFKLLLKSDGTKMGKTAGGAVWLDADKTTPYNFYQYWRNVDDPDVVNCLKLLTELDMEQINEMSTWKDEKINKAKEVLAYEVTRMIHGEEEAEKAQKSAKDIFLGGGISENMPTTEVDKAELEAGIDAASLLVKCGLCASKGEARRLISQNGVTMWDKAIESFDTIISTKDMKDEAIILKKGKKVYHKVIAK